MAKGKQTLSDEEREQRRAEQRELVRASIEQLRSTDGWQAYLKVRSRFHSYSWRNVLLILHQHPTAERVAGFRAWLDLGYCVTKGSRAIRIWAPCPPTKRQLQAWRDAGANPDEKPRGGFKLTCVFDTLSRLCCRN
jgi:N-terminal domain of anti-restriction factor ArdC